MTFMKVFFLISLLVYCFFYFTRFEHFLGWEIVSSIDASAFSVSSFIQGPFELNLVGTRYLVEENFVGSEVKDTSLLGWGLAVVCWFGFAYLLALATFFKRYFFLFCCGLILFFTISMDLEGINAWGLGEDQRISTVLAFLAIAIPAYLFHAFYTGTNLLARIIVFFVIFLALAGSLKLTSGLSLPYLQAATSNGFAALALLFVILVSEEIVFGILYIVTQGKGKGNEKHFILISLIYLGFVTMYFLKKAGIYENTLAFVNPYLLLVISSVVALWTYPFKQVTFNRTFGIDLDLRHYLFALGILFAGYLSTGFVAGIDPLYESFHYTITYAHLAFGFIFLVYIIANFIDALIEGHSVYKIAYKERNFPYATAKIVGFVGFGAFFLMANKEPLELTQAARLDFLGDHYLKTRQFRLAEEYYLQASFFGYNTHYSNYQLGLLAKAKNDYKEAEARFRLSTKRYPTEQAFVNTASFVSEKDHATAIGLLQYALSQFEGSGELTNNVANRLASQGRLTEAKELLDNSPDTESWNFAPMVNLLRIQAAANEINPDELQDLPSSALRANGLYALMGHDIDTNKIDLKMDRKAYSLHDLALINNAAYFPVISYPQEVYEQAVAAVYNPELQFHLKLARFFDLYQSGYIDESLFYLQGLIYQFEGIKRGELLNLMGLIQLHHGLLAEAMISFEESQQSGFRHAKLNEAICALELADWSRARVLWSDLVAGDPSYSTYLAEVEPIFDESAPIESFVALYYHGSAISVSDLPTYLKELRLGDRELAALWKKLSQAAIRKWDVEQFRRYFSFFKPFLSIDNLEKGTYQLKVLEGSTEGNVHKANAYDVINTMDTVRQLRKSDPLAAYQLLIDALRLSTEEMIYHQELVMVASEIGLQDYANQSLEKLQSLMEAEAFEQFKAKIPQPLSF